MCARNRVARLQTLSEKNINTFNDLTHEHHIHGVNNNNYLLNDPTLICNSITMIQTEAELIWILYIFIYLCSGHGQLSIIYRKSKTDALHKHKELFRIIAISKMYSNMPYKFTKPLYIISISISQQVYLYPEPKKKRTIFCHKILYRFLCVLSFGL